MRRGFWVQLIVAQANKLEPSPFPSFFILLESILILIAIPPATALDLTLDQINFCTLAAERGDSVAQYNLGLLYYRGIGVPKNLVESANWFEKSASQNEPNAAYMVAVMIHNGEGFDRNEQLAMDWLKYAAELGNKNAASFLFNLQKQPPLQMEKSEQLVATLQDAKNIGTQDAQLTWDYFPLPTEGAKWIYGMYGVQEVIGAKTHFIVNRIGKNNDEVKVIFKHFLEMPGIGIRSGEELHSSAMGIIRKKAPSIVDEYVPIMNSLNKRKGTVLIGTTLPKILLKIPSKTNETWNCKYPGEQEEMIAGITCKLLPGFHKISVPVGEFECVAVQVTAEIVDRKTKKKTKMLHKNYIAKNVGVVCEDWEGDGQWSRAVRLLSIAESPTVQNVSFGKSILTWDFYPVPTVGTKWIYETPPPAVVDLGPRQVVATAVVEDEGIYRIRYSVELPRQVGSQSIEDVVIDKKNGSVTLVHCRSYFDEWNANNILLKVPGVTGGSWTFTDRGEKKNYKILGTETIVVPAGTFECVVILDESQGMKYFYAKNVGLVATDGTSKDEADFGQWRRLDYLTYFQP